ncbi:ABC transporter ATP-binding protein [Haliscomenobacter hydrossis]|uniref:Monosaccharide-transporting ATPase n=1 Tax=Haliscomenobacter hydrossis (strain ATCC 27775 / DSM 1100 / LMG 10767 / O) TaxID=760192 RepID=F4KWH6_HALH1|nr:ATP-binding cassette domain-containing protein [Haliscomenobacter hydrossis]AEE50326.1 Monosaccharide-transporting ATPase [Haliscomenobacter hydrossis DSM 1100]
MDLILDLQNVVKTYDKKIAVNNVSFGVPRASIFGLLGPNGAGKTSLIRIITTITRADGGKVFLDGQELNSLHPEQIGYMPEERGLYKKMKVGEHLTYLGRLKGLSSSDTKIALKYWMEKFEVSDWWGKKIEELSKGMQQKIQFIATVLHNPKLIILDEPFTGLDPINTNLLKDEIAELSDKGVSIIFSTHRMEQVEEICDNIVLIDQGQNILHGPVKTIRNSFKKNRFQVDFAEEWKGTLPSGFEVVDQKPSSLVVGLGEGGNSNALLQYLLGQGAQISAFNEILPSLNEIFIQAVNKNHGLVSL